MILAIDIGGTAAKMGLMDQSGKIYARQEVSVNFDHYETPILKTVINMFQYHLGKMNLYCHIRIL